MPLKREKAPSCDEDHEVIRRTEKKLLDQIAELSEMVLLKKGYGAGYQRGLTPSQELEQRLLDLQILRARHA